MQIKIKKYFVLVLIIILNSYCIITWRNKDLDKNYSKVPSFNKGSTICLLNPVGVKEIYIGSEEKFKIDKYGFQKLDWNTKYDFLDESKSIKEEEILIIKIKSKFSKNDPRFVNKLSNSIQKLGFQFKEFIYLEEDNKELLSELEKWKLKTGNFSNLVEIEKIKKILDSKWKDSDGCTKITGYIDDDKTEPNKLEPLYYGEGCKEKLQEHISQLNKFNFFSAVSINYNSFLPDPKFIRNTDCNSTLRINTNEAMEGNTLSRVLNLITLGVFPAWSHSDFYNGSVIIQDTETKEYRISFRASGHAILSWLLLPTFGLFWDRSIDHATGAKKEYLKFYRHF